MPLIKGKSKESFSKNVGTEMEAGKPLKQSLAIAYSMKHKAKKKMAEGGMSERPKEDMMPMSRKERAMKMFEGGMAHAQDEYDPMEHPMPKHDHRAMMEDDRALGQHGAEEVADYGEDRMDTPHRRVDMVPDAHDEYQSEDHDEDMVGRIMKQRAMMFSKGGRVANEDHGPDEDRLAGFSPNEFDELEKDDDLEFHDTGANSGDELGDEREDMDRADSKDIVSKIMRMRKEKLPKIP